MNGDRYEGQWVHGKREGFGALTLGYGNAEEKYQGEWLNDQQEGMGSYSWRSGEHFEGTYRGGNRIEVFVKSLLMLFLNLILLLLIYFIRESICIMEERELS